MCQSQTFVGYGVMEDNGRRALVGPAFDMDDDNKAKKAALAFGMYARH